MARASSNSALALAACCVLLLASMCRAACPARCPKKQFCSKGKCVPKGRAKAPCTSGDQCLYGICFKKTCRELDGSLVYEAVNRRDATWVALKRSFQAQKGIKYVTVTCPYPTPLGGDPESPRKATSTGIVHSIELEETSYCYPTKQYGCLPGGQGVSSVKVTCWAINQKTTEPVANGQLAGASIRTAGKNDSKKTSNPIRVQPAPPAGNIRKKVLGTRRLRSGFKNGVVGFTRVSVTDHISTLTGAWPYEVCSAKPDGCKQTLPPNSRNTLKCPPKTSLMGLRLALFTGLQGDTYLGVDAIFCTDPVSEPIRLR